MVDVIKLTWWIVILMASPWAYGLSAQDNSREIQDTVEVIRGLRERRLFELAELYCKDQLVSEAIPTADKYLIVLERIQVKVAEAISTTSEKRTRAWRSAFRFLVDFENQFPNHPKRLLIQIQDALIHVAYGNLIQQELQAEIARPTQQLDALTQFRLATKKLRDIEREIVNRIPSAPSKSPTDLTQDQLVNLQNNIRYRLAIVNLEKAQLYDPDDKLNRIDALSQVLKRLDEVITSSNSELDLWWEAQISRAKCMRLMNNQGQFYKLILSLPSEFLNDEIKTSLLTERVTAAVEFGIRRQWPELIDEFVQTEKPTPQLRLAVLKLLMADAATAASGAKQAQQKRATDLVKQIELSHGKYWGRRAEIVLVGAVAGDVSNNADTSDREILVRQGDSAFRKKNFADAVRAYAKATEIAKSVEDGRQAMAIVVRLAQSHEQLKQFHLASVALFEVADRFVDEQSSDAIHLRGCWNLGQQQQQKDLLIGRLETHIARWPARTTADQARVWLGNALEKEFQWKAAIDVYLTVSQDETLKLQAAQRVRIAIQRWITESRKTGDTGKTVAAQFIDMVDLAARETWHEANQKLCVAVVEVGLSTGALDPSQALTFLSLIPAAQCIKDILIWRVIALAKQAASSNDGLAGLMSTVKALPNEEALLRVCLTGIKATLTEAEQTKLADVVVMVCDKALVTSKKASREFWLIEKEVAQANSTDPLKKDAAGLSELAKKYPKSLRIQLAFARALTKNGDDQAIQQWRRLAKKVKNGGETWYQAKYNVVALMVADEQPEEARKLVEYLSATTPGWSDSGWSKKFERLFD